MLGTFWRPQDKLLETKMDPFGTHVGGHRPSRAPLRFLKDVLYGLHGFAIEDPCSSLRETGRGNTFSHTSHNPAPTAQNKVPEPSKRDPKTLIWSLRTPLENGPETGHQEKSLFAPATHRGECCFRALDPGNGTPVIYRYIYIYV